MSKSSILASYIVAVFIVPTIMPAEARPSGFDDVPGLSAYYCPKYDAVLQFSQNGTMKAFGAEYPAFDPGSSHPAANTATELKTCSGSTNISCVEEVSSS